MIGFGLRIILRHHRAIRSLAGANRATIATPSIASDGKSEISTARQMQTIRAGTPGNLSRKEAVVLIGIGTAILLICLLSYLRVRPTPEQIRTKPEIFVVTEPIKLTGSFFGVALGKHRIRGEFLDKKWSTSVVSVFFLSDANGTPFRSDLPAQIRVDGATARLDNSIAYGITSSIHTQYAWKTSLLGGIVVFVDNASSSDIVVTVDSQTLSILPAFSHARITVKEGIHTFESRVADSSELIDNNRVFLSDCDRGASGRTIEWYVYNIGGHNTYQLESARYIPSSYR
jgi:hypothetical protein